MALPNKEDDEGEVPVVYTWLLIVHSVLLSPFFKKYPFFLKLGLEV